MIVKECSLCTKADMVKCSEFCIHFFQFVHTQKASHQFLDILKCSCPPFILGASIFVFTGYGMRERKCGMRERNFQAIAVFKRKRREGFERDQLQFK